MLLFANTLNYLCFLGLTMHLQRQQQQHLISSNRYSSINSIVNLQMIISMVKQRRRIDVGRNSGQ